MSKKFRVLILLISLSLTLSMMSNTYSRYVANTTGNIDAAFAKWQILINGNNDITDGSTSSITIAPTIIPNENVKEGTLAPSSTGYFDIEIDPSNVELSFDYEITLTYDNTNMPDLVISKYAIIDENTNEDSLVFTTLNSNKITGSLNYDNQTDNFKFNTYTVRVYFEWYEGQDELMNDEDDTEVGLNAATEDTSFTIAANITFSQRMAE